MNIRMGGGGGGGGGEGGGYQRPQIVQISDRYEPIGGSYAPRTNNDLMAATRAAEMDSVRSRHALVDKQFMYHLATTGLHAAIAVAPHAFKMGQDLWAGFRAPPPPPPRPSAAAARAAEMRNRRVGSNTPHLEGARGAMDATGFEDRLAGYEREIRVRELREALASSAPPSASRVSAASSGSFTLNGSPRGSSHISTPGFSPTHSEARLGVFDSVFSARGEPRHTEITPQAFAAASAALHDSARTGMREPGGAKKT